MKDKDNLVFIILCMIMLLYRIMQEITNWDLLKEKNFCENRSFLLVNLQKKVAPIMH